MRRNRRQLLSGALASAALLVGLAVAGGVWLNSMVDKRERVSRVENQTIALIGEAERLMGVNAASTNYDDDSTFRQAQQLAHRIRELPGIEEASDALQAHRQQLLDSVDSEARDRELIADIEEAMMMSMRTGSAGGMHTWADKPRDGYADAFKGHGADLAEQAVAETVAWLGTRRNVVRERLLAGMLDWAKLLEEESPEGIRLKAVVASASPDPWRTGLHRAIEEEDRVALEALAGGEALGDQPILTALSLSGALGRAGSLAAEEAVARRLQRERPESFWTNFMLGGVLSDRINPGRFVSLEKGSLGGAVTRTIYLNVAEGMPELDEATGFYRAAVVARPDVGAGWLNLGMALSGGNHLDEEVASCREAIRLDPEMAMAHSNLGLALTQSGQFAQAQTALDEARLHGFQGPIASRLAHIESLVKSLRTREDELTDMLRQEGPDASSVPTTLREISGIIPFQDLPVGAVQAYWNDHRNEVAAELGSATLRTITIPKRPNNPARSPADQKQLAQEIHEELLAGADFAEMARKHSIDNFKERGGLRGEITWDSEELRKDLVDVAFALNSGEIKLVEDQSAQGFYYLIKVDSRRPGKSGDADDFDAPGVREEAMKLLTEQRRKQWEENYLTQLQKRLAEEDAAAPVDPSAPPADDPAN